MSVSVNYRGRRPTDVGKRVTKALTVEVPNSIKRTGLAWFNASFKNQGFTDNGFQPWKPRKKEQRRVFLGSKRRFKSNAPENRAILIKSGRLWRGNDAMILPGVVRFFNRTLYAEVHNNGGRAGRRLAALIPRRRFMGRSQMMIEEMRRNSRRIVLDSLKT
jgi:hypothetical protein